MAITLTITPSDTLVSSGQTIGFMLNVANTDGSTREVSVVSPVAVTPGMSANFGVPLFDGTLADSSSINIPFNAVFFVPAISDGSAESVTFDFKVNVEVQTTAGAISSQKVSDTISMSVVPTIPGAHQPLVDSFPALNFQSNNNAIYKVLPLV